MALEIKDLQVGTKIKDKTSGNVFKVTNVSKTKVWFEIKIVGETKTFYKHDASFKNWEIISQPPKLKQVILTMTEEQLEILNEYRLELDTCLIIPDSNDDADDYETIIRYEKIEIKDVE